MMFELLQEHLTAQLKAMAAANKAGMEALLEHMSTIMGISSKKH
jgi:hypothetical protein